MAKKNKENILKLDTPEYMEYTVRLETDKDIHKFIKRVESIARSSMEYRDYIVFLKTYVNMSACAFFNGVENSAGNKVRIEVHHDPLTLYDITKIIINKHLQEGIAISDLAIAEEVIEQHYRNTVGLIPLSKSLHEIVHNSNEIKIPLMLVYGDYRAFIDEYAEYIDNEIIDKIERKINESREIKQSMIDKLTPNYTYVSVDGFQLIKKIPTSEHNTA